jgi:hypothetical protein
MLAVIETPEDASTLYCRKVTSKHCFSITARKLLVRAEEIRLRAAFVCFFIPFLLDTKDHQHAIHGLSFENARHT